MNDRLAGILLGTAVGDALGLPAEGLHPARRRRMMPGPWRHRFLLRRGMISDDTEHTLFVGQSLLQHPDNVVAFQRCLAWRLRWWIMGLPAGLGLATARACVKLWLGFSPKRSGVFSAGNGPAMRSALIGGYLYRDVHAIKEFVLASTRLTHSDPRAATGALAIAQLAAWAVEHSASEPPSIDLVTDMLLQIAPNDREWKEQVGGIQLAFTAGVSVAEFADSLGLQKGVTGYMYHTVPVVVYAWLRHYGDFRSTMTAVLDCGGDTDTVGAIAGALAGATVGASGIPDKWLRGIVDWPRSVGLLRRIANRLSQQQREGRALGAVSYAWPAILPRNLLFLLVVLAHGFRRLAPPY
jgi:ADP-ribosyl-[dinitrogen reductase] hydrolase